MYTRGCVLMCFFSLSHKEHSHPSSALSNGGSERLTLGPLIRPHLLGILLQARHSSCDMERNPDYLPPPATFATASLFLFLSPRSSFSLRLTQTNTHRDTHTSSFHVCISAFTPLPQDEAKWGQIDMNPKETSQGVREKIERKKVVALCLRGNCKHKSTDILLCYSLCKCIHSSPWRP